MNIKRLFTIWIAATLLMSTEGTTANAKPQFDNPEWEAFFNNPSDKLPEGLPLGKGCISNYNPTQVAQAYQPYNMTNHKDIVLSKSTIQRELVYATQTQKDFLEAMSQKLKQITNDKTIQIPIEELTHETLDYPVSIGTLAHNPQTIKLGWFGIKKGKSILVKTGIYNENTNHIIDLDKQKYTSVVKKYKTLCKTHIQDLQNAKTIAELKSLTSDLYKKAIHSANRTNQYIREDQRQERIAAKRDEIALKAFDEPGTDIDMFDIESEQTEEDTWLDIDQREIRKNRVEKRKQENKKNRIQPDIPQMWTLLEAALTQTEVPIAKLSIPQTIEERIVLYGKQQNKPKELLDKILLLNQYQIHSGHITITLACNARDLYLGCQNPNDYPDPKALAILKKIRNLQSKDNQNLTPQEQTNQVPFPKDIKIKTQNNKKQPKAIEKLADPGLKLPF